MIHYAGLTGAQWFYGLLDRYDTDYDIIGISYYPWWHGFVLDSLEKTLANLAASHQKEVILAEFSYPFTLGWNDKTHNMVGQENQLIEGYQATSEGQRAYLLKVREIIEGIEGGSGFCYWAPDWVAFKGPDAYDGSAWENQALFDFGNRQLPGMGIFNP
jgi:arabinogalactan endo-1,4-beta-galactosidase